MANYSEDFIIEVRPTLDKDAKAKMRAEVDQITKTIKNSEKMVFDADFKYSGRKELKQLRKDIQEILGTNEKISRNTDLGKFDLDTKELELATRKMEQLGDVIDKQQAQGRADANFLSYKKVLPQLEKMKKIQQDIEKLDPSNANDLKRGNELLKEYRETARSVARLGYDKNAFTTSLKDDLQGQKQIREISTPVDMKKLSSESLDAKKHIAMINDEIYEMGRKSSTVDKLATDYDEVSQSANKARTNIDRTNDATSNPKGKRNIQSTKKETDNLVDSFKKMARWGAVAFAWRAMGQQVRDAILYIKDLDIALTEISVVTGKSREQVQALGKEFNRMAARLGRTTAEVAKASKIFFRQGKTTQEVMELVEATTIAASVAHIDLAEASDYLTSTLNGFQMEATQAMEVVDKFSAVGANAGTSFEEMAQALKKVAASANNANVDMDHMISYLATVSEVTREAPENIGTSFKTLFARMQKIKDGDMPKELNKVDSALQSIGISLVDTEGQIDSLQTIIEKLGARWKSLTKNQQAYLATSIAGTRQQVRFISLMDNYDRSLEILETSLNSAGEAQLQFGQYLEGVEAKLKQFKSSVESLYSSMVDTEDFKNFIDILIDLSFRLQSLVDDFGLLGTVALGLATVIGGKLLISLISSLGIFKGLTSFVIPAFISQMQAATGVLGGFKAVLAGLSMGIQEILLSLKAFSGFIGPLVAIGASIWVIKEAWDSVHYSIGEANEDLKEFADLNNELNKLGSGKRKIEEYEELNRQLENGNLTLEERKQLLKDIEKLELEIAGSVEGSETTYNEQGEAMAKDIERMREALQGGLDSEILDISSQLAENNNAFIKAKESVEDYEQSLKELRKERENSEFNIMGTGRTTEEIEKDIEELRESKKNVEEQKSIVSEIAMKWLTISGKDIDYLMESNKEELTEAEETLKKLIENRGSEESLREYEFNHIVLPSKGLEERAKNYAEEFWQLWRDAFGDRHDRDALVDKLRMLTEEDIETFVENPRLSELDSDVGRFLPEFVNSLDLEGLNADEKIIAITEALKDFNKESDNIRNATTNIDLFKQASSSLSEVKDDYTTLTSILETLEEGTEKLSVDQMKTLTDMYSNIPAEVATSGAAAVDFINSKMKQSETIAREAYSRLLMAQDDFTDATQTKITDAIKEEAKALDRRMDNYKTVAEFIADIESEMLTIRNEMYAAHSGMDLANLSMQMSKLRNLKEGIESKYQEAADELFERMIPKGTEEDLAKISTKVWDIVDAEIAWYESLYQILETQDDLENKASDMVWNIEKRIKLEKQKQKLMDAELRKMDEGIEKFELQQKLAESKNISLELLNELNSLFEDAIESQREKMIETAEDIKEKTIAIYEEEYERKLELAEEEYQDFMSKNDKRIAALRKRNETEDYRKDLKNIREEQEKIQDRINEYRLIGTEAARKKIHELEEEYGKKEEEIQEMKTEKRREQEIEALEEIGEANQDAHEDKMDQIEEEREDKISAIENEFDIAKLRIEDLKKITENFGSESSKAIDYLINDIEKLVNEYERAERKMDSLSDLETSLINTEEVQQRAGYRQMSPEHMAQMIDNKLKYQDAEETGKDINVKWTVQNEQIRKNYGIEEDTMGAGDLLEMFDKLFDKPWNEYAEGGISTSTQFAKLHGTKKKPEFIFNYEQMGALSELINGGSSISIGSLISVSGDITDGNVEEIKTAVDSGIEKLKRAMSDSGKITRISGSYL